MQHLDEGLIHSWLDGALSSDEAAQVEAHVAECPQCAAAVAEARGFIAASSRILTALDDAPRGVVPVARPARRRNWAAWQAAAAVLVVAIGSLVVLRNRGDEQFAMVETAGTNPVQQPAPPIAIQGSAPQKTAISSQKPSASVNERSIAKGASPGALTTTERALAPSRVADVAVMDAASEPPTLKVVETPSRLGERVTVYEVAPGDTVTLTELIATRENLVPVALLGRQSAGKSAPASEKARADAAVASGSAYSGAVGAVAAPAAAVSAPTPTPQAAFANTVRTIKWTDETTGNTMTLSGRKSEVQLQEIRRRIERERAAAAAKKKP